MGQDALTQCLGLKQPVCSMKLYRLPEQRDVIGVEEAGDRHQRLGTGLPEDVPRLPALEACIERHEHRAGGVQAEGGHDPLPHVRRPDRHPVATFDSHRQERARRVVRGRSQTRERQDPSVAHVYDRLSCREALRGAVEEPRRCSPFEVAANARLAHEHPPSPDLTARQATAALSCERPAGAANGAGGRRRDLDAQPGREEERAVHRSS